MTDKSYRGLDLSRFIMEQVLNEIDKNLLKKTVLNNLFLSKISMINNLSLVMFYCTSFMKDNIYYIKDYDTVVIAEFKNNTLYLQEVFALTNNKLNFNLLVLSLGFAGFVSAADNWFVSPAISAIATDFNISVSIAGAVITSYMIPYRFMQPIYGFFSDGFGKSNVLKCIICGLSLGTAGCYLL